MNLHEDGGVMIDLVFLTTLVVFFVICAAYAGGCETL